MSTAPQVDQRIGSQYPSFVVSSDVLAPILVLLDIGCILFAGLVTCGPGKIGVDSVGEGLFTGVLFVLLSKIGGLYRFQTILNAERAVTTLVFITFVAVAIVRTFRFWVSGFAAPLTASDASCVVFAMALLPMARIGFGKCVQAAVDANVVRGRRVVLIGDRVELERLTRSDLLHFGFHEVVRFGLSKGGMFDDLSPTDRSKIDMAMAVARVSDVKEFALVIPWKRDRAINEITACLRMSPLSVRLYPDQRTREILSQKREAQFDPFLSIEVQRQPLTKFERTCKRAFDIVLSLGGLVFLAPILIAAAVLIKLDSSGPIIFRQTRRGFDQRDFKIWKFRSMTVLEDGSNILQARKDDTRVTAVGRVLRRTSIDELPQLINVLKGEMSVVGPRPHAVAHDVHYGAQIEEYALRHHVKPGLTGAAQVAGLRGETRTLADMEARVKRDLWYINNWSIWLDAKIVAQTALALLRHESY